MKRSLALGCVLLVGFFCWAAQGAHALSPTPTPITPMPSFVPSAYVPQLLTMSTNLARNFGFAEDNFGIIENWTQTAIDLQRWYLVQAVPPDQPNARWVDRVNPDGQGYVLRSTDGQNCDSFCSTEAVQIAPAEEGVFYFLSASARVEMGSASLYLDFLDANRTRIEVHTRGGYTDRWTWQTVAAKAPPGTHYVRAILSTDNAARATAYWRWVCLHSLSAELSPMPPEGTDVAVEKPVIARAGGVTYPDWGHANDAADYNTTTRPGGGRWGNQTTRGTFETVDLGALYNLVGVGYFIDWDGAFRNPLTFQVEVSPDNAHWTTVSTIVHQPPSDGGNTFFNVDIPINPIVGRYVRYSEPPDGEWNGWGDLLHLRAYAAPGQAVSTVSPATTETIQPGPDFGATLTAQATTTQAAPPTPTIRSTLTPAPKLAVGGKARVHVIRNDTLSVRNGAGILNAMLERLVDGTVVTLLAGPVEADGYRWWRVRTPLGTEGWVVEQADEVQTLIPLP